MWGLNFTIIRFGLDEFAPFTFATWRFVICALPIAFVARPAQQEHRIVCRVLSRLQSRI